jgi:hypothetical protein
MPNIGITVSERHEQQAQSLADKGYYGSKASALAHAIRIGMPIMMEEVKTDLVIAKLDLKKSIEQELQGVSGTELADILHYIQSKKIHAPTL